MRLLLNTCKVGFLKCIKLQPVWFIRILPRFDENFIDSYDFYAALSRPLFYMLDHCESHNIHKLKPWIRRIVEQSQQRTVSSDEVQKITKMFKKYCKYNNAIQILENESRKRKSVYINTRRLR